MATAATALPAPLIGRRSFSLALGASEPKHSRKVLPPDREWPCARAVRAEQDLAAARSQEPIRCYRPTDVKDLSLRWAPSTAARPSHHAATRCPKSERGHRALRVGLAGINGARARHAVARTTLTQDASHRRHALTRGRQGVGEEGARRPCSVAAQARDESRGAVE